MEDSAQKVWVTVDGHKYLVEVGDLNQRPLPILLTFDLSETTHILLIQAKIGCSLPSF